MKRSLMRRFAGDRSATAAIQMAMILPVMVAGCLGMADLWSLFSSNINMRAGVNTAANLVMQGETNTATLQTAALAGWSNAPSGAAVTVDSNCSCSGIAVACTTLCAGNKAPSILYTIKASGNWKPPFSVNWLPVNSTIVSRQVIRVR